MWASVRDNGKGFDARLVQRSTHGLVGMRYRVEAAGGMLRVESRPGSGTLISAWLPSGGGPQAADLAKPPQAADPVPTRAPAPAASQAPSPVA